MIGHRWDFGTLSNRMIETIDKLGDSAELRIAKARVEEAAIWIDRHMAAKDLGRTTASTRRLLLDLFDRIAAAIAAKQSGDNAAYDTHLAALDEHLQKVDASDADEQTRLGNIEAGLNKVADAVNPPETTAAPDTAAPAAPQS